MADNSHASPTILPTAVNLEPEFPFPSQDDPNRSARKSPSAVSPNNNNTPQNEIDSSRVTSRTPSFSRFQTARDMSPPPRPWIQKSVTDVPQPSRKHSLLGRKRAGPDGRKPAQLTRQATLTFDPYSSDSSSSSDEEPALRRSLTEEQRAARDERKKHQHNPGPFSRFRIENEHFKTKGRVSQNDGRLRLNIHETLNSGYFAKALGAGFKKHFKGSDDTRSLASYDARAIEARKIAPEDDEMEHNPRRRVKLNVVIIVIGSRGDIQPFLKIGKILKEDYGHRVRIATHPVFRDFVEHDSGLEFFSVGGDPSELMAFMVKNPGLIPNYDTIREGEIGKRRAAMYEMFQGMWRACINSTDDEDDNANLKMMGDKRPFVADAIIANPPSFAPPHIAERLGIPLHMMFTFPYTPTVQFPHPLANIKASNVDAKYTNFMSYPLVELMTWQGLGDLVNRFREKTLGLEEVSTLWAPGNLYRLRVPYTYMWSPGLVPKPQDWGPEIDVSGFVFLDLASSFKPPEDLMTFLDGGPPPVYIGFGSIVVDDPDRFTKLIFEAVKLAGVRALVSKGWGGFGSNETSPDSIFMLENTPHDWLFPRVSAVVHHGGAGTTAIGLKCAKPTMIVPFFGDQPFWGAMVAKAKAGAHECIPYKKLTAERLAEGIKQCLTEEAKVNVQQIADSIAKEGDGALNAVRSFHRSLPLKGKGSMRCDILENQAAAWKLKGTKIKLSPIAAELLVEWKKIKWNELRLTRHYEWNDFGGPGEPFTGTWGAIVSTASDIAASLGYVPVEMAKSVKRREKYYERRFKVYKRQKHIKKTLAKANAEAPHDGTTNGITKNDSNTGRSVASLQRARTISDIPEPEGLLAQELAKEAKMGVRKSIGAIVRLPVRLNLALVQGFHNAPRLYGDETVRRPPRITGLHSGIRAGRDEFVYGIRDGVTGLWKQPYHGAKEGGALGFIQGFGMGIGGFVLKDIAACIGPEAYFLKGLHEEYMKKYQPTNYIRRARIIQGQKELSEVAPKAPRRSGRYEQDHGPEATKRRELEMKVSRKWEDLQPRIRYEMKHHRSGIRASLMGKSQSKGGRSIPRKSSKRSMNVPPPDQPKKTASVPIDQAEKMPQPNHWSNFNREANGSFPRLDRSSTAPMAATQWKEKAERKKKYRLETVPDSVKQEIKDEGVAKREVPNVFVGSPSAEEKVVRVDDRADSHLAADGDRRESI